MKRQQGGFTLVEIAIVLVIIGLLLGGILKGQELINSARVRNLADTNSGIQAAYYGFIDRYRNVPGDWAPAAATTAIGETVVLPDGGGAIGNGRVDNNLPEAAGVWEQLSKAGFIQGQYNPTAGPTDDGATYTGFAPSNPFGGALTLTRNDDYEDDGTASDRLNLHLGLNIPVNIARELDVKLDDERPQTGDLRLSSPSAPFASLHAVDTGVSCMTGTTPEEYNIAGDSQDCGVVYLY